MTLNLPPVGPVADREIDALAILMRDTIQALAIYNARLYQQQKEFADTMQRSLLPRSRPAVAGLAIAFWPRSRKASA